MSKRASLMAAIVSALALTIALPASANSIPTTGTSISVIVPPTTFPANTPFYIDEGFACQTIQGDPDFVGDCMNAGTHFDLYLAGVAQPSQVDIDNQPGLWLKRNLTNYANGLPAGNHTFVGTFIYDGAVVATYTATILFT